MTIYDPRSIGSRDRASEGSWQPFIDLHSFQWVDLGTVVDATNLAFSKRDGVFFVQYAGATKSGGFVQKVTSVSGTPVFQAVLPGTTAADVDFDGTVAAGDIGLAVVAGEIVIDNNLTEDVVVSIMRIG